MMGDHIGLDTRSKAEQNGRAGDGDGPAEHGPDLHLGPRGSIVFIAADLDLASQMRRVHCPTVCYVMEAGRIREAVDRRLALVIHLDGNRPFALQAQGGIERLYHPERVGLLCLAELGFPGPADSFVSWWSDALEDGRYDDLTDFIGQAEKRAEWRTFHVNHVHVAGTREDEPPIPAPEWPGPPAPAAFHGLAGDVVRAIGPNSEADEAAILFQSLAAFGSVIGRGPYVRVGRTSHRANEFSLLIGRTSAARKGTSWDDVSPLFLEADGDWRRARVLNGLSTGEGLIHAVRDRLETKEPVRQKGRIVDYQDVIADHGVEDKRLLVMEQEFGRVLQVMSREGNTLSAVLRMAWDGVRLAVMTKGCPYAADEAHIGVVGHITAEEFSDLLSACDVANGLLNRFLLVCCRRPRLLPFSGHVDDVVMDGLARRLKAAAQFAREAGEVRWTEGAMAIWRDEYPRLTAPRPGAYGLATSRAEAHALRLALQYTLLDLSNRIGAVHLRAALAAWDYCQRSARHIFGDRTGDDDADRILDALRAAPGVMTRTQIRREVFYDNKPASLIAAKLGKLLEMQLIERQSIPTSGRTAEAWRACAGNVHVKNVESPPEFLPPATNVHVKNVESPTESADEDPFHVNHVHVAQTDQDPQPNGVWVDGVGVCVRDSHPF
jgi:hypothetical protein